MRKYRNLFYAALRRVTNTSALFT